MYNYDDFDDDEENQLTNFDYPPTGITKDMLNEWKKSKDKIRKDSFESDRNFYHSCKYFKKVLIDAGVFSAIFVKFPYHNFLVEKLSNINIKGKNGTVLLEVVFVFLLIKGAIDLTRCLTGEGSKHMEKKRVIALEKKSREEIQRLYNDWLEKGLIDKNNKPWCLREK